MAILCWSYIAGVIVYNIGGPDSEIVVSLPILIASGFIPSALISAANAFIAHSREGSKERDLFDNPSWARTKYFGTGFRIKQGESVGGQYYVEVPLQVGELVVDAFDCRHSRIGIWMTGGFLAITNRRLIFSGLLPKEPRLANSKSLPLEEVRHFRVRRLLFIRWLFLVPFTGVLVTMEGGRMHAFMPQLKDSSLLIDLIEAVKNNHDRDGAVLPGVSQTHLFSN